MHIHFSKIRYKNILSVGGVFTEIELDKTPTTLITGKNGAGKCVRGSTEIDVIFQDDETQKKFEDFLKKQV